MKTELLARSVHASIILIVTMAVGGCVMWPGKTTYTTPEKPSGVREGKASRTLVLEKLGNPGEQTADGRLALYDYTRTQRLHTVGFLVDFFDVFYFPTYHQDESQTRFLLLVVYDANDFVKPVRSTNASHRSTRQATLCVVRKTQHVVCWWRLTIRRW